MKSEASLHGYIGGLQVKSIKYNIHPELLQELLDYGEKKSHYSRVQRVYYKAIRARKMKLAEAIRKAYPDCFPSFDMSFALAIALAVSCDEKLKGFYEKEDPNA